MASNFFETAMTKKRKEKQLHQNIEDKHEESETSFSTIQLQERAFRDTESVFSQMLSHSK